MKVVIIAAGQGNRLWQKTNGTPKTLLPFGSGTVLSTIVDNFVQAGVREFVFVLGYNSHIIKEYVQSLNKEDISVEIAYNNRWQLGNGLSVLAAQSVVGEETFILSMSDHLVAPSALQRIVQAPDERNQLLVDPRINDVFDIDDATKVVVEDDRIENIGKEISDYNAVDCGIFKLTPRFFTAMNEQAQKGQDSISAGIRQLIAQNDMHAVYIGANDFWIDVDTPEAYHHAEKYFLQTIEQ